MKKALALALLLLAAALLFGCTAQLPAASGSGVVTISVDSETAAEAMSLLEELAGQLSEEELAVDEAGIRETVARMFALLDSETMPIEDLPLRLRDVQNDPELLNRLYVFAHETVAEAGESADAQQMQQVARQLFGVDITGAPAALAQGEAPGQYLPPEALDAAGQAAQSLPGEADTSAASLPAGADAAAIAEQAARYEPLHHNFVVDTNGLVTYTFDLQKQGTDGPQDAGNYTFTFQIIREEDHLYLRFVDLKKNS